MTVQYIEQTLPTGSDPVGWQAACWTGTHFHLFEDGFGGTGVSLRSATGAGGTWSSNPITQRDYRCCAGFNDVVVAAGADLNCAYTTNAGATFNVGTMPSVGPWVGMATDGSRFISLRSGGGGASQSAYSTDNGLSWTGVAMPGANINWRNVVWTGTEFVAIGYDGTNDRAVRSASADGTAWSALINASAVGYDPIWVANQGATLVVVAHVGTFETLRSTDGGLTWSQVDTGLVLLASGNTVGIAANEDGFFVVGYDLTQPLFSADGITWENANFPVGTLVQYFMPAGIAAGDFRVIAASNWMAGFAMNYDNDVATATPSPFFHFTFA